MTADASLAGFLQELGWVLILIGGPMIAAASWTLWTERRDARRRAAVWARRDREAAARETFAAGQWL